MSNSSTNAQEFQANNGKIVVWSKTGCHFCQEIKTYLETNGYEYSNLEVAGNDVLRDVLDAKYGIRHVPVVEVGHGATYTALLEADLEKLQQLLQQQQVQVSL